METNSATSEHKIDFQNKMKLGHSALIQAAAS